MLDCEDLPGLTGEDAVEERDALCGGFDSLGVGRFVRTPRGRAMEGCGAVGR